MDQNIERSSCKVVKMDLFGCFCQCTELVFLMQLNEKLKREAFLLVKQVVDCLTKQITITTAGGTAAPSGLG